MRYDNEGSACARRARLRGSSVPPPQNVFHAAQAGKTQNGACLTACVQKSAGEKSAARRQRCRRRYGRRAAGMGVRGIAQRRSAKRCSEIFLSSSVCPEREEVLTDWIIGRGRCRQKCACAACSEGEREIVVAGRGVVCSAQEAKRRKAEAGNGLKRNSKSQNKMAKMQPQKECAWCACDLSFLRRFYETKERKKKVRAKGHKKCTKCTITRSAPAKKKNER